jgi:hypothetical protein
MPVPPQARRLRGRSLALSLTVAALLAATLAAGWQLVGAPVGPGELSGPWSWLPMLVFGAACAVAGCSGAAWSVMPSCVRPRRTSRPWPS